MRYDDQIVEKVQSAHDIVEVISQYVPLKKAGRNFKGVCPFHQEKTPSFMVSPEKQIFHCFGCSAGGDVFSFLMRYENMSFPETLRLLAEKAHIPLPQQIGDKDGQKKSDTEQLYAVYEAAVQYYQSLYNHPEAGRLARDYFRKRGFPQELEEEFRLGWAPNQWRGLYEYLVKKKFPESVLLKSSLIQRSAQGKFFDVFRGRLLFPICNLQGKTVGFGGRLIAGEDGPKYLNSPENPIFQKRKELFGLYLAKRHISREHPRVLVVEGYMDFFRLYAAGFKDTVATLGTALTNDHVRMLKRFAEEAVVIYDGDKAGEMASLRGSEVFLEEGMAVKLVRMPEGLDPDDYVQKKGGPAFGELLKNAQDFFDFKLTSLLARYSLKDSLGMMKISKELLETLAKIKQPILLEHYVKKMSASIGLNEASIRTELARLQKQPASGFMRSQKEAPAPQPPRFSATSQSEILLLALMIDDPRFAHEATQELAVSDFSQPLARSIFQWLPQLESADAFTRLKRTLSKIRDEDFKNKLVVIGDFDWSHEEKRKAFQDCVRKLKRSKADAQLQDLRQKLLEAESKGEKDLWHSLMQEYQDLERAKRRENKP